MIRPTCALCFGRVVKLAFLAFLLAVASIASATNSPQPASGQQQATPSRAQGSTAAANGPNFDVTTEPPGDRFTFIVYGDTRFMDPNDTRHSNPTARVALVHKIAKEKPFFVAVSGDLVFEGSNVQEWLEYERETKVWRDQSVTVFPAIGNHDLRGGDAAALANYFPRFPLIDSKRWYSVRSGNVELLVLDSNANDNPGSQQAKWLEDNLSIVPDAIDFVVIVLHHPPYTESTAHMLGGGHEARKQEQELAQIIEGHQAKMRAKILVIAGHVHNYERYERGGVMYIVSGGGGATPYLIKRKLGDFYSEPGPTYHYCRFRVEGPHLKGEMIKYIDQNNFQAKDTFELSAK
jgi:Icc-related predicted phosphoesterase